MTRVLHVANFSLHAKGAFQHSVSIKLSNGLIRNGHSVTTLGRGSKEKDGKTRIPVASAQEKRLAL